MALPAKRYSHIPLLGRMELRHNFTAYAYIALGEATQSFTPAMRSCAKATAHESASSRTDRRRVSLLS